VCGIAGFSGSFDSGLLERMNARQAHRGPDDSGVWFAGEKGIGLAHRRLSIIDVSESGHQPMHDVSGALTIVYNGEIYNYRELRRDLSASGLAFRSQSDTEVLLNLYLRDGPEMVERLNGIFAFALWDRRDDSLFLARDGVGVKPLYYAETARGFLFASEIKALLEDETLSRELDPLAIHGVLTFLWCPAPHTLLRSVRKLPPGHTLRIKEGRIESKRSFYDLPYRGAPGRMTPSNAATRVRESVQQAVERQMVADVPVGAFLSGGLDSSAVAAFAQRAMGSQKLQCFTIGFRDDAFRREGFAEDLPYAQKVAKHLGVDLHTIHVGPEMSDHLETMIYHLDEVESDPAPINVLLISQLARENGIKVLLSGAWGDDIFGGYRRHYALMQERFWSWLPAPARKLLAAASRSVPVRTPAGRRIRRALQFADHDGNSRIASYFSWTDPDVQRGLYAAPLRDALAHETTLAPLMESLSVLPPDVSPLDRMLYLEGKHFLADHNLNYTDKMGMARGVEIRVPLLDIELIDLATSIPPSLKQRGRVGKWVFKKAMEEILPREIIYRPKTGFGAPLRFWMQNQLRPLVDGVLSDASLRHRGLFDPQGVRALRAMDDAGRVDGTNTLFAVMLIELWCRIFLDARLPVAVAS
jgi:asparagine synthase (glutamine-hydrolysing)